jgi:CHAD domain-containing protein
MSEDGNMLARDVQAMLALQVDTAAAEATDLQVPAAERVHNTRKRIKRIRAMLRLMRVAMEEEDYRRHMEWFGERGRLLSAARDADVLVTTHSRLRSLEKQPPAPDDDVVLEALVRSRESTYRAAPPEELLDQVGRDLRAQAAEWQTTPLDMAATPPAGKVLAGSVKRYKRALRRAERSPAGGRFHSLRKRVKDITYQMDFISTWAPEGNGRLRRRAARLGHVLGWGHDVQVYSDRLQNLEEVPKSLRKTWRKVAHRERRRVRERALRRSRRFLGLASRRLG